MSYDFEITYAKELTRAAWLKQKSFKEKVSKSTKTGLGDELAKAELAWRAIPFKTLRAANFQPKNWDEAKRNLDNAKFVMQQHVKRAQAVLKAAQQKAALTAKNKLLSETAQAAAAEIAKHLFMKKELLKTIGVNDFKLAITKLEAAKSGGRALQRVTLFARGAEIGQGAKGIRNKDNTVTVYEIKWGKTFGANPDALLQGKIKVRSHNEDDSLYENDMILIKLSSTKKTATLK